MQNTENPLQLREQIHLGRFKIKQLDGDTLPVKQQPECHLAIQIVQDREQQRTAWRNLKQESKKHTHLLRLRSMGWLVDEFVEGQVVAVKCTVPRLLQAKSLSAADDAPKADTRSECEKTNTAQTAISS